MKRPIALFTKLALCATLVAVLSTTTAQAAGITFVGSQTDLGPGWRTASVSKPLDLDGDNVLGTDGYVMVNKNPVLPGYLSQATILNGTYPGNGGYASIDDPTAPPTQFVTGTMNPSPGIGNSADLFSFTVNGNAVGRKIRVGLMMDNLDIAAFNAVSLELLRTNGIQGTSGAVPTTNAVFNDRVPDWLFFDILAPSAGDTFIIRGVAGIGSTATLGGVAFDSVPVTVVTNAADSGPGTLRTAIANTALGGTIAFATNLTGATIVLTSGNLVVTQSVTIDASSLPGGMTISGNASSIIFNLQNGSMTMIFNSLIITNGMGGGILDGGNLIMNQCTVTGNSGGGISVQNGFLTMNQCTLSGNSAPVQGGAIFGGGHTVTLNNCTLSGNSAGSEGGAIYAGFTTVTLNQCTIANNAAGPADSPNGEAGAIYGTFGGSLTLNQCTVTGNRAGQVVGGIFTQNPLTLNNCIVAGNPEFVAGEAADIVFQGTTLTFVGANLIEEMGGTGNGPAPIRGAPILMPLGNYGGPTQTMPPLPGSPALDGVSDSVTNTFPTDQRGLPRLSGPQVDIGAAESQYSTLVVTNAADNGAGSLRTAIADAAPYFATITFAPNLSGQTITLTNGELLLNRDLTIDGSALAQPVQVSGNHASRVFDVSSGSAVILNALTITHGNAAGGASGGGINNSGTLTLNQCQVTSNTVTPVAPGGTTIKPLNTGISGGGGIFNGGTLTLNQCVVSANFVANPSSSDANGGGLLNIGTLGLNGCVLTGNSVINHIDGSANGGALYNNGTATLTACTLSANSAFDAVYNSSANGGGIYNVSTLVFNNCTLSGNAASADALSFANGGGINNNGGNLTLNQCTLSGNSSSDVGGGFFVSAGTVSLNQSTVSANSVNADGGAGGGLFMDGGTFNMTNSILAGNSEGVDSEYIFSGNFNSTGVNIIDDPPMLAALGNYGGPTQTMPPQPGSPAIDACTNGTSFATDQRGFPRVLGLFADAGAAESSFSSAIPSVLTGLKQSGNGTFLLAFSNHPGTSFTVLASTNATLPLNTWTNLGAATEVTGSPGQFLFSDPQATNFPQRFYRVRQP